MTEINKKRPSWYVKQDPDVDVLKTGKRFTDSRML
jgi:hypothetical protein